MSVINATPLLAAAGGDYQISRSVRLRSSASAYFNRTPASAGNRKTWTWSGWVKRGTLGSIQVLFGSWTSGSNTMGLLLNGDKIFWDCYNTALQGTQTSNAVLRDTAAWYHIVWSMDTTQATSSNRSRFYINGVQVTSWSSDSQPAQNIDLFINAANQHTIGNTSVSQGNYFDGYLTEINFIDGQALTPSSFGETDTITGVWKPKKYAGTYGTNGFYLNFSDNSSNTATTIGKDNSGNGNNWTPNNISVTAGATYDSMIDVPTLYADGGNGRGNYAVLNPLKPLAAPAPTYSRGNLEVTVNSATAAAGTIALPTTGKWMWDVEVSTIYAAIGIANPSNPGGVVPSNAYGIYANNANGVWYALGSSGTSANAFNTAGDVAVCAVDVDNTKMWIGRYRAGVLVWIGGGDPTAGTSPTFSGTGGGGVYATTLNLSSNIWYPYVEAGSTVSCNFNFGQRPFAYTPPTGFKALNTQNLPAPTILKGNQYFNTVLYTGNGTSQSVSGVGFQPDFVWLKARSNAQNHTLYDAVRGTTKYLISNATTAETTNSETLKTFDSDGFSLGNAFPNDSGYTYVAWNWKANGSAVTNTSGSITSQVNAGTSQGFSVVTYTGTGSTATVGHGLGVAPKMVIIKGRSNTYDWVVFNANLNNGSSPFNYAVYLNQTVAQGAYAGMNNTAPTSTVFSLGTNLGVNASSATYVAYCFSEVAGFSKFGSYTGNNSTDGPFVFCGFRPRFVLIKDTTTTGYWVIYDSARDTYNVVNEYLQPQSSAAAFSTYAQIDLLSNGFKIRQSNATSGQNNVSGNTYIFAAFAESPFKNSLAR